MLLLTALLILGKVFLAATANVGFITNGVGVGASSTRKTWTSQLPFDSTFSTILEVLWSAGAQSIDASGVYISANIIGGARTSG